MNCKEYQLSFNCYLWVLLNYVQLFLLMIYQVSQLVLAINQLLSMDIIELFSTIIIDN